MYNAILHNGFEFSVNRRNPVVAALPEQFAQLNSDFGGVGLGLGQVTEQLAFQSGGMEVLEGVVDLTADQPQANFREAGGLSDGLFLDKALGRPVHVVIETAA